MSATINPDDLTETVQDQLVEFARNARVDARHRNGGALNNAMTMANVEMLDTLNLEEGVLQDPANVIAIVFNPDVVPETFVDVQDEITEPAVGVEVKHTGDGDLESGFEYAEFQFEAGHTACINTEYLAHIEEVYGVDPIETPEVVLGHPEYDTFPIRVNDDAGTHMMIAPVILDNDW